MKKHNKFIAIAVTVCFLISFVAGPAATQMLSAAEATAQYKQIFTNFVLPYSFGQITSAHYGATDRVLINIQDLHSHPKVQKNISNIIELFDKKYGVNKVFLEGAYGQVSTKWIEEKTNKRNKNKILEMMLETGRLTGAEYYSAKSDKTEIIEGLEKKEPYLDNLKRFGQLLEEQDKIEDILKAISDSTKDLKERYYGTRQKKIEKLSQDYKDNKISSKKYYTLLAKHIDKLGIDLNKYENTLTYIMLLDLQKGLDYSKITKELQNLVYVLKGQLPYNAYKKLLEHTDNFTRTDSLYAYIIQIARLYELDLRVNFPNLDKYFRYIELSQKINPIELVGEEEKLRHEINTRFSETKAQREVVFLLNFEKYLRDYITTKITSQDYKYYKENIKEYIEIYNKYADNRVLSLLEDYIKEVDNFYEINDDRNIYFTDNLFSAEQETGTMYNAEYTINDKNNQNEISKIIENMKEVKTVDIVITGGFHSQTVTDILKEHGVSYIVITPNVTDGVKLAEDTYHNIVKEQSRISFQTLASLVTSLSITDQIKILKAAGISDEELAGIYGADRISKAMEEGSAATSILQNVDGKTINLAKVLESDETGDVRANMLDKIRTQIGEELKGNVTQEIVDKIETNRLKNLLEDKEKLEKVVRTLSEDNPLKQALNTVADFIGDAKPFSVIYQTTSSALQTRETVEYLRRLGYEKGYTNPDEYKNSVGGLFLGVVLETFSLWKIFPIGKMKSFIQDHDNPTMGQKIAVWVIRALSIGTGLITSIGLAISINPFLAILGIPALIAMEWYSHFIWNVIRTTLPAKTQPVTASQQRQQSPYGSFESVRNSAFNYINYMNNIFGVNNSSYGTTVQNVTRDLRMQNIHFQAGEITERQYGQLLLRSDAFAELINNFNTATAWGRTNYGGRQEGLYVNLQGYNGEIIVVGDVHANFPKLLQKIKANEEKLRTGRAIIVFEGDYIHRETSDYINHRPNITEQEKNEKMNSSIATIQLLMNLKIAYPQNVYLLAGNHDIGIAFAKGNSLQGIEFYNALNSRYGNNASTFYENTMRQNLALVAETNNYIITHAGPAKFSNWREYLRSRTAISINSRSVDLSLLENQLLWGRYNASDPSQRYGDADVMNFVGNKLLIVGHTHTKNNSFYEIINSRALAIIDSVSTNGYGVINQTRYSSAELLLPSTKRVLDTLGNTRIIKALYKNNAGENFKNTRLGTAIGVNIETFSFWKKDFVEKHDDIRTPEQIAGARAVVWRIKAFGIGLGINFVILSVFNPISAAFIIPAVLLTQNILHYFYDRYVLGKEAENIGRELESIKNMITDIDNGKISRLSVLTNEEERQQQALKEKAKELFKENKKHLEDSITEIEKKFLAELNEAKAQDITNVEQFNKKTDLENRLISNIESMWQEDENGERHLKYKELTDENLMTEIDKINRYGNVFERLEKITERLANVPEEERRALEDSLLDLVENILCKSLVGLYNDETTREHVKRVMKYSIRMDKYFAEPLSLSEKKDLLIAALMHDIGKDLVPDEAILNKVGKLTDEEFLIMRGHVWMGARILMGSVLSKYPRIVQVAENHHEANYTAASLTKDDSFVHPGNDILSEKVAVVDIFEAVASYIVRPYQFKNFVLDIERLLRNDSNKTINEIKSTPLGAQIIQELLTDISNIRTGTYEISSFNDEEYKADEEQKMTLAMMDFIDKIMYKKDADKDREAIFAKIREEKRKSVRESGFKAILKAKIGDIFFYIEHETGLNDEEFGNKFKQDKIFAEEWTKKIYDFVKEISDRENAKGNKLEFQEDTIKAFIKFYFNEEDVEVNRALLEDLSGDEAGSYIVSEEEQNKNITRLMPVKGLRKFFDNLFNRAANIIKPLKDSLNPSFPSVQERAVKLGTGMDRETANVDGVQGSLVIAGSEAEARELKQKGIRAAYARAALSNEIGGVKIIENYKGTRKDIRVKMSKDGTEIKFCLKADMEINGQDLEELIQVLAEEIASGRGITGFNGVTQIVRSTDEDALNAIKIKITDSITVPGKELKNDLTKRKDLRPGKIARICREEEKALDTKTFVITQEQAMANAENIEQLRQDGYKFIISYNGFQQAGEITLDGAKIDATDIKTAEEAKRFLKEIRNKKNAHKDGINKMVSVKLSEKVYKELFDMKADIFDQYGITPIVDGETGELVKGKKEVEDTITEDKFEKMIRDGEVVSIVVNEDSKEFISKNKDRIRQMKTARAKFVKGLNAAQTQGKKFEYKADITDKWVLDVLGEIVSTDASKDIDKNKLNNAINKIRGSLSADAITYIEFLESKNGSGEYEELLGFIRGILFNSISEQLIKTGNLDEDSLYADRNSDRVQAILIMTAQRVLTGEKVEELLAKIEGSDDLTAERYLEAKIAKLNETMEEVLRDNDMRIDISEEAIAAADFDGIPELLMDSYGQKATLGKDVEISIFAVKSMLSAA